MGRKRKVRAMHTDSGPPAPAGWRCLTVQKLRVFAQKRLICIPPARRTLATMHEIIAVVLLQRTFRGWKASDGEGGEMVDPITLESLQSRIRSFTVLENVFPAEGTSVVRLAYFAFEPFNLARYLISSAKFHNPATRTAFTPTDVYRLAGMVGIRDGDGQIATSTRSEHSSEGAGNGRDFRNQLVWTFENRVAIQRRIASTLDEEFARTQVVTSTLAHILDRLVYDEDRVREIRQAEVRDSILRVHVLGALRELDQDVLPHLRALAVSSPEAANCLTDACVEQVCATGLVISEDIKVELVFWFKLNRATRSEDHVSEIFDAMVGNNEAERVPDHSPFLRGLREMPGLVTESGMQRFQVGGTGVESGIFRRVRAEGSRTGQRHIHFVTPSHNPFPEIAAANASVATNLRTTSDYMEDAVTHNGMEGGSGALSTDRGQVTVPPLPNGLAAAGSSTTGTNERLWADGSLVYVSAVPPAVGIEHSHNHSHEVDETLAVYFQRIQALLVGGQDAPLVAGMCSSEGCRFCRPQPS